MSTPTTKTTPKKTAAPRKRKANYLNNADMLEQVILSKQQGKITDELAKMFILLARRFASRPNFSGYSYRDEMEANAILQLTKEWRSFDETRYSNAFSYYTQCCYTAFVSVLNAEKKNRRIRDKMMVENGLDPSFSYQQEHAADFEADLQPGEILDINPVKYKEETEPRALGYTAKATHVDHAEVEVLDDSELQYDLWDDVEAEAEDDSHDDFSDDIGADTTVD